MTISEHISLDETVNNVDLARKELQVLIDRLLQVKATVQLTDKLEISIKVTTD